MLCPFSTIVSVHLHSTLTDTHKCQSLTGVGAVHGCEQVWQLGPLGWGDVMAHVNDAVHGNIRVGLHQAEHNREITIKNMLSLY